MVSGATYSARAFRDAVAQALSKAAAGSTTQG
jgi:major membrane immunogen (membrane-anchored lipoprotein)